jgi:uncharacterized membrane protein YfcA
MFRGGFAPERAAAEGRLPLPLLVATALGVGLLTGVVGIGGGFLVVPALVLLAGLPMKRAVGTSLVVIAMNAGSGLVGYLGRVEIAWDVVAAFTAIATRHGRADAVAEPRRAPDSVDPRGAPGARRLNEDPTC